MGNERDNAPAPAARTAAPAPEPAAPDLAPAAAAGNRAIATLLRAAGAAPPAAPPTAPPGGGSSGAGPLDPGISSAIESERGGGAALPDSVRADIEYHLGVNLSEVRVHTGPTANELSRSVQADAFTSGTDVFFAAGRYDPASNSGRELLAHELTHVAQQASGPIGNDGQVSHPDDPAEVQARHVARQIAAAPTLAPGRDDLMDPDAGAGRPALGPDDLMVPDADTGDSGPGPDDLMVPDAEPEESRPGPDDLMDPDADADDADAGPADLSALDIVGSVLGLDRLRNPDTEDDTDDDTGDGDDGLGLELDDLMDPDEDTDPDDADEPGPGPDELMDPNADPNGSGPGDLVNPSAVARRSAPGPDDLMDPNADPNGSGPGDLVPSAAARRSAPGRDDLMDPNTDASGSALGPDELMDPNADGTGPGPDDLMNPNAAAGGSGPDPDGLMDPNAGPNAGPGAAGDAGDRQAVNSGADAMRVLEAPPRPVPPLAPSRPDPTVATWKQETRQHIGAIRPADTSKIRSQPAKLAGKAAEVQAKKAADKPDYAAENRKAIPAQPATEAPVPAPEPDPVPAATALLHDAAALRLADQTVPKLDRSPQVRDETWQVTVDGLLPGELPAPVPAPAAALPGGAAAAGGGQTDPRMEKTRQQVAKVVPAEERHVTPAEPVTLTDQGPAGPLAVPPATRADLTAAVSKLVAAVPQTSAGFVHAGMADAFAGGVLVEVAPQLGEPVKAEIEAELTRELYGIATEAGVATQTLDESVASLRQQAAAEAAQGQAELAQAGGQATAAIQQQAHDEQGLITGTGTAAAEHIAATKEAATGQVDPALTEEKAKRLRQRAFDDAAAVRANQRLAVERRRAELLEWSNKQAGASETTANAQLKRIRDAYDRSPAASADADPAATREARGKAAVQASTSTLTWSRHNALVASSAAAELTRQLERNAAELEQRVSAAENQAVELVAQWRDARLGQERSWWQRLLDLVAGWSDQATAANRAWEHTRNADSAGRAVADAELMANLQQALRTENQAEVVRLTTGLDAAQRVVLQTYLAGGTTVDALAAGLMTRIGQRRIPELIKRFEAAAEGLTDWQTLERLGVAQNPGFRAQNLADRVYDAVNRWGTHESDVYAALGGLTKIQVAAVRGAYAFLGHGDLDARIKSEMSGVEYDRAERMLAADSVGAEVAELRDAKAGWLTGAGKDTIMRLLRGKTPEQMREFAGRFAEQADKSLDEWLADNLHDTDLERARALVAGDVNRADAIALRGALDTSSDVPVMEFGTGGGPGPDTETITSVTADIRGDVAAEGAATRASTAEIDAQYRQRMGAVSDQYGQLTGTGATGLTDQMSSVLSGTDRDRALAQVAGDQTGVDSARLRAESENLLVTGDEQVNQVLRRQWERAQTDARRDVLAQFDVEARTQPWGKDPAQVQRRRQALDARIDAEARNRAAGNMAALRNRYDTNYAGRSHGTVDSVIADQTSGVDQEQAQDLVRQDGRLERWQEMDYAIRGLGTKEEVIKQQLHDPHDSNRLLSKAEIAKLKAEYQAHRGASLDDDLHGDLSGRDEHDIFSMIQGEPETAEERLRRAHEDATWERDEDDDDPAARFGRKDPEAGIGQRFTGEENEALKRSLGAADDAYNAYKEALASGDAKAIRAAQERFERRTGGVYSSIESHRSAVDSITETAAMIAGAAAGILVIIASAGTLTPAVAALAAAATGATSMAVKAVMLGHAYGAEDMAIDAVAAAADVAGAAATAGLANYLMRTSMLARIAGAGRLGKFAATATAEGLENALGGIPSGLVTALLNDDLWRSENPFGMLAESAGMTAAVGLGMGIGLAGAHTAVSAAHGALRKPPGSIPAAALGETPALHAVEDLARGHADLAGGRQHGSTAAGEIHNEVRLPEADPRGHADVAGGRQHGSTAAGEIHNEARLGDEPAHAGAGEHQRGPAAEHEVIEDWGDWLPAETVMQPADPTNVGEAVAMYQQLREKSPGREAAHYYNPVTNEHIVVQGEQFTVGVGNNQSPQAYTPQRWKEILDGHDVGRWELVAHSHPDAVPGSVAAAGMLPSDADMAILQNEAYMAGAARESRLDYNVNGEHRTVNFGFDPKEPKGFWVEPLDGGALERFATMDEYLRYFEQATGVSVGAPPAAGVVPVAGVTPVGHAGTGTGTGGGSGAPLGADARGHADVAGGRQHGPAVAGEIQNDVPLPAADPRGHAVLAGGETRPGSAVSGETESEPRTAMQEQVERASGMEPTADYRQRQDELADFYRNQQTEAANATEVRSMRIDQMVDSAGNPLFNPDGSAYGYGIRQGFTVRRFEYDGAMVTELTMRIKLEPRPGVSAAEVALVQGNTHGGMDHYYNDKKLKLPNGDRLHVTVEFVDNAAGADLVVDLRPGSGRAVQNAWYVGSEPTTIAHELTHQAGAIDEYVDVGTANRASPQAAGVFHDDSLMGDYWLKDAQGNHVVDAAGQSVVNPNTAVKQRHLDQLGGDIDAARAAQAAAGAPAGSAAVAPAPSRTVGGGSSGMPTRQSEALGKADVRIRTVEAMLDRNPLLRTQFEGELRTLQMAFADQRAKFGDLSPDSAARSGGFEALTAVEQSVGLERRAADMIGRIEAAAAGGPAVAGAFDNAAFVERIRHLPASERVALVEQTAGQIAQSRGWTYDQRLSTLNNRSVYRDPAGRLYGVDTQHGTFEVCAASGKHEGEVNFVMERLEDRQRDHDLKIR